MSFPKLKREVVVPASHRPFGPSLLTFLPIVLAGLAAVVITAAVIDLVDQARMRRGERVACGTSARLDCAVMFAGELVTPSVPVYLAPPAAVREPSVPECAVTHDVTSIEVRGRALRDQPAAFMVPVTVYRCPVSETADRLYWHRAGATDRSYATIPADARVDYVTAGGVVDLR